MSKKLLLVLPCVPFPERSNGICIRYFPLIKRLSCDYTLDAVILLKGNVFKERGTAELSRYLRHIKIIDSPSTDQVSIFRKARARLASLNPWSIPWEYYSYYHRQNALEIAAILSSSDYQRVIFVGISNGQEQLYLQRKGILAREKTIVDMIDSVSLHASRTLAGRGLPGALRLRKLERWEANVIRHSHSTIYISENDKGYISTATGTGANAGVCPNGIYVEDYQKSGAGEDFPSIGFLGNMSYPPNVEGALYAYEVYLKYKKLNPKLKYYIIGRSPAPVIRALGQEEGVVVTGEVDNIWQYIESVSVFVVMLSSGAGQQNKLLEVMYAAKPVVANAIANSGIGARHREQIMLAEDENECVELLGELLRDRELRVAIGNAGRQYVVAKYSFENVYMKYRSILEKTWR